MAPRTCPTNDQLSQYVRGRLAEVDHENVDRHLDLCQSCSSLVETLDGQAGTWFDVLKRPPSKDPIDDEPELRELVKLAKSVRASNPPPLRPGDVLGNYELSELIGVGGMGQVFRAYHRRMKRDVAVKVVSPNLLQSESARARFQREVEAVAQLSHPNIVAAYDADEADGHHFLVLELVDGRNLAEIIEETGPVSVSQAVNYMLQTAKGLQYAHKRGIVHRDIKPANLMLSGTRLQGDSDPRQIDSAAAGINDATIKILDMGLARVLIENNASPDGRLTTSQAMLGTASFMAPEQAQNPGQADHRADIYSLGCSLFYLLTGKQVFDGQTVMEVVFAHRDQTIPDLPDSVEECPPRLASLLKRMLAKQPSDRPQSMYQVIEELKRIRSEKHAPQKFGVPRRTIARVYVWIAAIVLLAASVGGALVWYQSGRNDRLHAQTPGKRQEQPTSPPPRTPVIEMLRVSPGEFEMGAHERDPRATADQKPRHRVRISQPFMMSKFEITRAQFREVMAESDTPDTTGPDDADADQRPISGVNWITAIEFCNRLSRRHGLRPYYEVEDGVVRQLGGNGFHLPTEAQWEYACRAGSTARWHFGDDSTRLDEFEWHAGNSDGRPQPVGRLKPNAWGLHDMHGNVPEWCWDRYDPEYYQRSPAVDPPGSPHGQQRVFRGGSASNRVTQTSAAERAALGGSYGASIDEIDLLLTADSRIPGSQGVGIRVIRSIE